MIQPLEPVPELSLPFKVHVDEARVHGGGRQAGEVEKHTRQSTLEQTLFGMVRTSRVLVQG